MRTSKDIAKPAVGARIRGAEASLSVAGRGLVNEQREIN